MRNEEQKTKNQKRNTKNKQPRIEQVQRTKKEDKRKQLWRTTSSCKLPADGILVDKSNVMRSLRGPRFCVMSSSMLPEAAWELSSIYIYIYIYIEREREREI